MLNDSPTEQTIRTIGAAHRQYGTTGYLPTVITDDISVTKAAIEAVRRAMANGAPGVLGIHVEGPYISKAYSSIHLRSKISDFD